jgi:hypothetical protein
MSGYWVIVAPAAAAAMVGVIALSRHLAYRPRHGPDLAPFPAEPFAGSMTLADDPNAHRRPARLGTWFPHPDPWPHGWPQADGWTAGDLADLHDAPTALDALELASTALDALEPVLREQFGRVDQVVPDDRLPLEPGPIILEQPEPDQLVALAAEVAHYQRDQDTETGLYLADLADRNRTYLRELREHL